MRISFRYYGTRPDTQFGFFPYMTRLTRWIRGDIQILGWIRDKSLNKLSKYKIIDNLRRSLTTIMVLVNLIVLTVSKIFIKINIMPYILVSITSLVISSIIDILNYIIFRKENIKVQKKFTKRIDGIVASIYRGMTEILVLPYKGVLLLQTIIKTIYRMLVTKEHLLEWTTAEEVEALSKNDLRLAYKNMIFNVIFGILGLVSLRFINTRDNFRNICKFTPSFMDYSSFYYVLYK